MKLRVWRKALLCGFEIIVLMKCQKQKSFCILKDLIDRSSHRKCSVRKVFLEISQNLQENTCVRVSFLIKLQASVCNFIKKETLALLFSCEFCEIPKSTFFTEHLWATAYVLKFDRLHVI